MKIDTSAPLWAITSYFNPLRSVRRLANFRTFRKHLGARLLAVELSRDGHYDLAEEDADLLIRVNGGDTLWQKERLLNLALRALPDDCDNVAWLDADIVFIDQDWQHRVSEALRQFPLIQVFDRLVDLGPNQVVPELVRNLNGTPARRSLACGIREGRSGAAARGRPPH